MMKKKIKKIILTCISLLMIFSSGINFVHAQTRASRPMANGNIADAGARLRHTEPNGYWEEAYWMSGLTKVRIDGTDAFCIEPNTIGLGGNYYPDETAFSKPLRDKLSFNRILWLGPHQKQMMIIPPLNI